MKFKDILPNRIYHYGGTARLRSYYFRTFDTVTAVPSPAAAYDSTRKTHLLLFTDIGHRDDDGNARSGDDRYVDHGEVLRWVDNEGGFGLINGDQTHDLTFQPEPFVQSTQKLSKYYDPFLTDEEGEAQDAAELAAADELAETGTGTGWVDPWPAKRAALVAEWGTERYWDVTTGTTLRRYSEYSGKVPLSSISGPYDEAELAATELTRRAERAERQAAHAESSKVRAALRQDAEAFLVSTLANAPDALVEQTHNGLPREVERARQFGNCGWSLEYDSHRDEPNTLTPDGDSLVGLKASTLAAISYAWRQVYGDSSWEDIVAGVYERYHEADVVKHIYVTSPNGEDVEVTAERVARYLPANYTVTGTEEYRESSVVYVKGSDVAGWTAEGYVIPRLASGLLTAEVVSLSRRAVSA